jgi:hypothetical protein
MDVMCGIGCVRDELFFPVLQPIYLCKPVYTRTIYVIKHVHNHFITMCAKHLEFVLKGITFMQDFKYVTKQLRMEEILIKKIKGGLLGIKNKTKKPADVLPLLSRLKEINPGMFNELNNDYLAMVQKD